MKFVKVQERSWIRWVAIVILISWAGLLIHLLKIRGIRSPIRATLASVLLLIAGWIGVFPQTHTLLPPLLGSFDLHIPALAAKPQIPPVPQVSKKSPSKKSSALQVKQDTSVKPVPKPPKINPLPAARNDGVFHTKIRNLSHHFFWLHIPLFAGSALLLFLVTGSAKSWPFIVALAILMETIPPSVRYGFDSKDALDLLLNLIGIALGVIVWKRLKPLLSKLQLIPQKHAG